MPQPKRSRRVLAPLGVAVIAALFVLVLAPAIATAQDNDEAQCLKLLPPPTQEKPPTYEGPPRPLPALIFNGDVTIGGSAPSRQGYTITARMGENWESNAVPVGVGSGCGNKRYEHLIVAPPEELDLFGSQIQFWLKGQVRSEVYDWYSQYDFRYLQEFPAVDPQWTFPIFRHIDLEFPALPDVYRPDGSLPPTGGASPSRPMLAAFLLLEPARDAQRIGRRASMTNLTNARSRSTL